MFIADISMFGGINTVLGELWGNLGIGLCLWHIRFAILNSHFAAST
jgi:hypothetical protein